MPKARVSYSGKGTCESNTYGRSHHNVKIMMENKIEKSDDDGELSGIEQARGLTSSSDGRSHIGANTAGAKY